MYLSGKCLMEILVGIFRARLSEALTVIILCVPTLIFHSNVLHTQLTSKKINNLEENDRVMPLLDCLR